MDETTKEVKPGERVKQGLLCNVASVAESQRPQTPPSPMKNTSSKKLLLSSSFKNK